MQQGDLVQELTHAELTKERSKYHHFSFPVQGMYFDLVISSISTCQYLCMKIQKHNTPLHTLLPLGRQWVNKHMPDGSCIAQCTTGRHSVTAETNTAHRKSRKSLQSSSFLVLCGHIPLSTTDSWSSTRSIHIFKQRTVAYPRFYMVDIEADRWTKSKGSYSSRTFNPITTYC